MKTKITLLLLFTTFLFFSCTKKESHISLTKDYDSEVVQDWIGLMLKLSKETPGFTPPVAARMYGYIGVGLYESLLSGMPGYQSLEGQINDLNPGDIPKIEYGEYLHWGLVANAALAYLVNDCYKVTSEENLNQIAALEKEYEKKFKHGTPNQLFNASVNYGKEVAKAVIAYANTDGQALCYENNFPLDFAPPVGDGLWVPTPPAYQRALQPYWGYVRPFVTANVTEALPPAPPTYSTDPASDFYAEAIEVYDAVTNVTPEQKTIAQFWSDDPGKTATPPGHSLSILRQVLIQENADLEIAAEALAKVGMGTHDAFISCWKSKYVYNLMRPITYIREQIDPAFDVILNTPPFPEYTSGHSVQSGAAAQILSDMFGYNYTFTDRTHENRTDIDGSPRTFSSFFDFADEAAISRLYGGIHYMSAIALGVDQGKKVGANISALQFN